MTQHIPYAHARTWIVACFLCVFLMVWIGGVTRLTESGLSIVEWKPITGILLPLSESAWQDEFAAYQNSPQFQKINSTMGVEDFKGIFWLEYLHRLMGRVTGFVFLLPLIFFAVKGASGWLPRRMVALTVLVGMQGGIGWLMVKSGLVDAPYVSPVRLAIHLVMAFLVGALLVATYLRLTHEAKGLSLTRPYTGASRYKEPFFFSILALAGVLLQVIFGALVAGYDAGLIYNTFPLMDGQWIPDGINTLSPWYVNMLENTMTVQFQHRVMAFIAAACVIVLALRCRRESSVTRSFATLAACTVLAQMAIGIATLLHVVPIWLASLHQMVAFLLFCFCAATSYLLYYSRITEAEREHVTFPTRTCLTMKLQSLGQDAQDSRKL